MPYSASQRYKPALQYKNGLQIDYSNYVLKKRLEKTKFTTNVIRARKG